MPARPPFATLSAYATALSQIVRSTKSARTDADFIADALEKYAEDNPATEVVDIVGDGTQKEWQLGETGGQFASWVPGFSTKLGVGAENLDDNGDPQDPPEDLHKGRDYRIEDRTVGGKPVQVLRFTDAPQLLPKTRFRFKRRWDAADVPEHHQMPVVYLAAHFKAVALQAIYADTVDPVEGGSDLFQAIGTGESYVQIASRAIANYNRVLGIGTRGPSLTTSRARTNIGRVFPRGYR